MLLDSPGHDDPVGTVDGTQLLRPGTARDWTRTHRAGMFDHTFNATIDWGLGFIRDSKHHADDPAKIPYGFGTHASPETFGHGGWQSTVGLADPPRQLAAAVVFNGCPGELPHRRRMHAVLTTLYEDLGLVP
jgi:CubicO group peptidase (beta-lactamase class C family)